jgi:protein-L-isoaspartate(D-aspartate) O-methyltransferase
VGAERQVLIQIVRRGDRFERTELEAVKFVPLLGGVVR